jgi:hypothetical protein
MLQAAATILANARADPLWLHSFGLHASADAVNTGLLTAAETSDILTRHFNDVTQICSLSSFNMFWVLQALGNLGLMDKAQEAIRLCWGGQVSPPPGESFLAPCNRTLPLLWLCWGLLFVAGGAGCHHVLGGGRPPICA